MLVYNDELEMIALSHLRFVNLLNARAKENHLKKKNRKTINRLQNSAMFFIYLACVQEKKIIFNFSLSPNHTQQVKGIKCCKLAMACLRCNANQIRASFCFSVSKTELSMNTLG